MEVIFRAISLLVFCVLSTRFITAKLDVIEAISVTGVSRNKVFRSVSVETAARRSVAALVQYDIIVYWSSRCHGVAEVFMILKATDSQSEQIHLQKSWAWGITPRSRAKPSVYRIMIKPVDGLSSILISTNNTGPVPKFDQILIIKDDSTVYEFDVISRSRRSTEATTTEASLLLEYPAISIRFRKTGMCINPLQSYLPPPINSPLIVSYNCGTLDSLFTITTAGTIQHLASGLCFDINDVTATIDSTTDATDTTTNATDIPDNFNSNLDCEDRGSRVVGNNGQIGGKVSTSDGGGDGSEDNPGINTGNNATGAGRYIGGRIHLGGGSRGGMYGKGGRGGSNNGKGLFRIGHGDGRNQEGRVGTGGRHGDGDDGDENPETSTKFRNPNGRIVNIGNHDDAGPYTAGPIHHGGEFRRLGRINDGRLRGNKHGDSGMGGVFQASIRGRHRPINPRINDVLQSQGDGPLVENEFEDQDIPDRKSIITVTSRSLQAKISRLFLRETCLLAFSYKNQTKAKLIEKRTLLNWCLQENKTGNCVGYVNRRVVLVPCGDERTFLEFADKQGSQVTPKTSGQLQKLVSGTTGSKPSSSITSAPPTTTTTTTTAINQCGNSCPSICYPSCSQSCCSGSEGTTDQCGNNCPSTCSPSCTQSCCSQGNTDSMSETGYPIMSPQYPSSQSSCPSDCSAQNCGQSCPQTCCQSNTGQTQPMNTQGQMPQTPCPSGCKKGCRPHCPFNCC